MTDQSLQDLTGEPARFVRGFVLSALCQSAYWQQAGIRAPRYAALGVKHERTLALRTQADEATPIAQVLCLGDDGVIVLVFHGSEAFLNRMSENALQLSNHIGTDVFSEFFEIIERFWEPIGQFLKEQQNGRSLWLAGHGVGGALANLAAFKLQSLGTIPEMITTFGAVPAGKRQWLEAYQGSSLAPRSEHWIITLDPAPYLAEVSQPIGRARYLDWIAGAVLDDIAQIAPSPRAWEFHSPARYNRSVLALISQTQRQGILDFIRPTHSWMWARYIGELGLGRMELQPSSLAEAAMTPQSLAYEASGSLRGLAAWYI